MDEPYSALGQGVPLPTVATYSGSLAGPDCRVAVVVSRFNELIGQQLLRGALQTLLRHGVPVAQLSISWVPGAWELPLVAQRWARSTQVDAVLCLGAVIRGETPHFDFVCAQTASGMMHTSLATGVPIVLGLLTTATLEQALQRAGGKAGNKGAEAASAALEMIQLLRQLPSSPQNSL